MALKFIPRNKILIHELFDGRLEQYGVYEMATSKPSSGLRCLFDNKNHLWIKGDDVVEEIFRFGLSAPGIILAAIENTFKTYLFSEYKPVLPWDFATLEEKDLWGKINTITAYEDALYEEILHFDPKIPFPLRDSDSLDDILVLIAVNLLARYPEFDDFGRKQDLLSASNAILESDEVLDAVIELSSDELSEVIIREINRYMLTKEQESGIPYFCETLGSIQTVH